MNIANQLKNIENLVCDAEKTYHRPPHSVKILAASKGQSIEKIIEVFHAGQRIFGENYLQEALKKMEIFSQKMQNEPGFFEVEWHFIGPIQSNKTKKIAENFAWVHSVDSEKIARRLNDQRPKNLPPLNICIEVNVSGEASKSGVFSENIIPFIQYCLSLPRLHLRGLMTIPAPQTDFNLQRAAFHRVHQLFEELRAKDIPLDTLSMGMSGDFVAAIAEGSTMVRIGTGIFGER
ncbi:MAG: hypothetical protein ACD_46C00619G0013 [uncultured bacterium]|nr:MAG: hypothetical protein ACD_46C00619G0013 [uncultured bacterium]